jgi:hypothetical protein
MSYYTSLTYETLFNEKRPNIEDFIKKIPLSSAIEFYSIICAQICMQPTRMDQEGIRSLIYTHLEEGKAQELEALIINKIKNIKDCLVFSIDNVNLSINYCINNLKEKSFSPLSKEEKYKLVLFLFITTSISNEKTEIIFNEKSKPFIKTTPKISTWPFTLYQTKLHSFVDPVSSIIKLYSFLFYFQNIKEYNKYLLKFLKEYNTKNIKDYASIFMQLSSSVLSSEITPSHIKIPEKYESFFDNLSINIDENQNSDIMNYSNLIRFPILKKCKLEYIVLNWNFFHGKIYNTLVFDFYNKSGINKNAKFNKQSDLLRLKGEEISEKILLKYFLQDILKENHSIIKFDDNSNPETPLPDCYYRKGNKVFLFELKDNLLSQNTLILKDIETIKTEINNKFNSSSKGTGQIIKQISSLVNNKIENLPKNLKFRNIEVYPIIIYTDCSFNLNGIEEYLNNNFDKSLNKTTLREVIKFIYQISFVHLDTFILYNKLFKEKGFTKTFSNIVKQVRNKNQNPTKEDLKTTLTDYNFEKVLRLSPEISSLSRLIDLNVLKKIVPYEEVI